MWFPPSLVVGAVCLSTGAALFASRGVLDRVLTAEGSVRLALLPPWQALAGFTLAAALALLFLTRSGSASPRTATGARVPTAAVVTPLFGLLALLLPYLPWLPDRLPALQMLAGPAKYLVWIVVLTQLAWVAWQTVPRPARLLEPLSPRSAALAVGLATLVLTGLAAGRIARTDLVPGGDEPHYLIIAQSLWDDGDFKIENNHLQGDYFAYFKQNLAPHYLTRGVDGEIYSIHPVGLPLLAAPVYALGGYLLVVMFLLMMAATATGLMWWWVASHTEHPGAATFACAAIALSPPFALNTFTVYPEIPAALAVVAAMCVMPRTDEAAHRLGRWAAVGVLAGVLPWLSTKYAPMSAAAIVVGLSRIWLTGSRAQALTEMSARLRGSAALVAPYLVMLAAWFTFFYLIWGTPKPQAPYGALVQTSPFNLILGGPGLLFDQEYGLLAFAPVYVLAATGLVTMWRAGGTPRRRAIEIAMLWAGLLGTVGAFGIWWGGSASPGRPVASGLLLLALPIAVAFRAAPPGTARRAAQHLLLWTGAWVTLLLLIPENGLLINNGRDTTSRMLEYVSPLWEAWTLAPSFISRDAPTATLHTLVWLALASLAAWALRRMRVASPGTASLAAIAAFLGTLVGVAILMPLLPTNATWPHVDLASRARLAGLDRFDRVSLPHAVVYDGVPRWMDAGHAENRLVLKVTPGARRDPQPARVLHNGRFSMPAGRYRVDLRYAAESPLPAAESEPIALQIGRLGAPLRAWSLTPSPGGHWQTEIDLPLDAGFVGFVGSPTLERSVAEIALTPLSLVDRARRVRAPQVLAAAQYGPTTVLFHDVRAYPERTGFWTMGEQRMQLAMANDEGHDGGIRLTLHSGPQANRVEISTAGWREVVDLQPETTASVTLPRPPRRVIELEIQTDRGFVPARVDASSQDRRNLGAWVEVQALPAPEIARRQ